MRNLFLLLFASFIITNADAQIHVTNNSSEPITVAIAYYKGTRSFKGWVSEGWFKLIPGETKVLGSFLKDGENTYYVHAHTSGYAKTWGNEVNLAVNSVDAFKLENCDKEYVLDGENIKKVGFKKHFVHIGLLELYKDYVSFTDL